MNADTLGLLAEFGRPHYVLRPRQLWRRFKLVARPVEGEQRVALPWGEEIICDAGENIGRQLVRRGVFDLLVCEVLTRLADPGELALDVGANIGQMSGVLARCVGPDGTVIAFEPHPVVFGRLDRNAAAWSAKRGNGTIDPRQVALSDRPGTGSLSTDVFEDNQGSASLEPMVAERGSLDVHTVATDRLDDIVGDRVVGVMKIDIEGHELKALQGASRALASGRIRDVVFEERGTPPTPVTQLLQGHGFTVFQVEERLRGPVVDRLGARDLKLRGDPKLLATRDPERALGRLARSGWAVLNIGGAARFRPQR